MIYSLCKTKKNGCIRSHPQQSDVVNEGKKPEGFLCHWTGADSALVFCLQNVILMEVLWY